MSRWRVALRLWDADFRDLCTYIYPWLFWAILKQLLRFWQHQVVAFKEIVITKPPIWRTFNRLQTCSGQYLPRSTNRWICTRGGFFASSFGIRGRVDWIVREANFFENSIAKLGPFLHKCPLCNRNKTHLNYY